MALLAKILVLDDEEDTQDLFSQKFRHEIADGKFEFAFAKNLDEVNKQLEESPFDIFISDINVANTDCVSLISDLRKTHPLMRSIVVSAYGDISTLRAVMRGGAHDFVTKPIDFKDLADTVNKTAKVVTNIKQVEANNQKLTAISGELNVSAQLQRSMLPGNVVKKGSIELFADTTPAADVGGDFYDYFWLSDTKLGVVMADVSGKNVSAAMFGVMAKTLIKSFARVYPSPAECFHVVNTMLCQENVQTMFVTAMYGIVDMEKNEMIYTNAGHLPIGLVKPNTEAVFLDCDPGMALGIWDGTEFCDNVHKFSPGEMIIMYTDGVNEAANLAGEEYDYDRFKKVLTDNSRASPQVLRQELMKSIREFIGEAPQSDDITTLCIRYRLRVMPNASRT